jgi:hypothetical protein
VVGVAVVAGGCVVCVVDVGFVVAVGLVVAVAVDVVPDWPAVVVVVPDVDLVLDDVDPDSSVVVVELDECPVGIVVGVGLPGDVVFFLVRFPGGPVALPPLSSVNALSRHLPGTTGD